ncbi:glycine zipper 2TM domain-containing protein [uncultured Sphingomonas sp.]|uniref:glycine zipper 2TM domain-containing protein n=1 Tax=uncultured Sphingomonas sp. TaxID=158754 RepID=UPI0025EAF1A4|nr:glycine zipper 2TM domain-containing protein [uncultured Sphingomonas sp.]
MRNMFLAAGAAALLVPASLTVPVAVETGYSKAEAQRNYRYREWRGRDGRYYCRKPNGTTGLVVGGVAGALVGRTIDTRGDRTVGTLLGAAAGAVAGREIERSGSRRSCR